MKFGAWDSVLHEDGEQQRRIATARKADTTPASVDRENRAALFKGSGKIPYETTLDFCTCGDFIKRKLPCKHIYRLALELDGGDVVQGVNKNEYAEPPDDIFTLPVESQEMLYDMCAALTQDCINIFIFERNEYNELLLHKGFCVETVLTLEAISTLAVAQIKQVLNMSLPGRDDLPKKTAQRKSCIAWLESNYDSVAAIIEKSVICLECTEHTEKVKHKIKRRYERRFVRDEMAHSMGDEHYYSTDIVKVFWQE